MGNHEKAVVPTMKLESEESRSFIQSGAKVLITGGVGFIGCNATTRFLSRGAEVIVLDNFSRAGQPKTWNGSADRKDVCWSWTQMFVTRHV